MVLNCCVIGVPHCCCDYVAIYRAYLESPVNLVRMDPTAVLDHLVKLDHLDRLVPLETGENEE